MDKLSSVIKKAEEAEQILHEINSPKINLMLIRDKLYSCSKNKADKLDKIIAKLEELQNC